MQRYLKGRRSSTTRRRVKQQGMRAKRFARNGKTVFGQAVMGSRWKLATGIASRSWGLFSLDCRRRTPSQKTPPATSMPMILIRLLSHSGVESGHFLRPHRYGERHSCLFGSNLGIEFRIAIVSRKAPSAALSWTGSDMGAL